MAEMQNRGESSPVTFDSLTEDEKKQVLSLLSRGMLSEDDKRQLWEACARSKLTDEEQKKIKRAFVLSAMTDEERKQLLVRNRQKTASAAPSAPTETSVPAETPVKTEPSVKPEQPVKTEPPAPQEVPAPAPAEEPRPAEEMPRRTVSAAETTVTAAAAAADAATATAVRENAVRDPEIRQRPRQQVKAEPRRREREEEPETDTTAITSLLKGIVYIVAVLVISVFASWAIISVGNDMFAFVKSDEVVTVVIGEDMTAKDVAQMLHENGVIEYPTIYELYIRLKHRSTDYLVGEYNITPSMSYKQLNRAFTYIETTREQVVITIPEGYTTDQMIDLFLSYGIGTKEGFVDAINNYPFEGYRFLDDMEKTDPERKYRLEGYLFPDTYYFFRDNSEVAVIDKLLSNFDRKISGGFYDRAEQLGYSMDEIITLASMIQAEGTTFDDFVNISSVFHNRLDHPKQYPKLQSDATLQYILDKRKVLLTADDLKIKSKYNSYLTDGLPPSAICNPSLDAINSALYPENTKFYYFLADAKGKTYFSETLEEHEAKKRELIDNVQ